MRECHGCGLELDDSEFYENRHTSSGYSYLCKECERQHMRDWQKTHKELVTARNKRSYERWKRVIDSYKTPCAKCGEDRPYVIHFHHVNPDNKLFNIGTTRKSSAAIAKEVSKCVCLCANCHEEFHWIYGNRPDNPEEALYEYLEETT